jgi:hypothetical protein
LSNDERFRKAANVDNFALQLPGTDFIVITLSGLKPKQCLRNLRMPLGRSELNLSLARAVILED